MSDAQAYQGIDTLETITDYVLDRKPEDTPNPSPVTHNPPSMTEKEVTYENPLILD